MTDFDPIPIRSAVRASIQNTVDPIIPSSILHQCDDIIVDGICEQSYNYLEYVFVRDDTVMFARAYLDEPATASIYPERMTTTDGGVGEEADAPELRRDVISYLRRRYAHLQILTPEGYEDI